ncbi:PEP-CTERM protein-sorting domain-containing protein [Marinobacter sp. es.048]|uniref:PEP-CTERM sorting domain-containing protein n=1 Tax=Marinobacter sp. es.048 TaxID=1761795 RepID=UPI000B593254|nr:PEP-CTERM sorting domain-containing protein [Marinobacter sp. es.048]SNC76978.1 PEP-CTERM protein-sorting domain-containing protein [Marinobacter sp. es.048]
MRISHLILPALFVFGVSGHANAYLIDDGSSPDLIDVGGLDTFVGQTTTLSNSGQGTETTWASMITNTTLTFADKTEDAAFFIAEGAGNESIVAFKLNTSPSYFLVKDGNAGDGKHVLFKNELNMDWGVFNLLDYFDESKLNELTLSHLTEFEGDSVKVPEPGSLGLFSLGILGLIAARKKLIHRT